MELSKFDIEYHPRGAIKGEAVVDFIAEYIFTPDTTTKMQDKPEKEANQAEWVVHVDGSTNIATGGGVILTTPERSKLEYAIRFGFKATNNETKYESMIIELRLARTLGATKVKVCSDS